MNQLFLKESCSERGTSFANESFEFLMSSLKEPDADGNGLGFDMFAALKDVYKNAIQHTK